MIELKNITAGYTREVDILRAISMSVGPTEIVTILGPNGCGKSTLLKTMAGFVIAREGQVLLSGSDVTRVPVYRKVRECGVGFVPQTDNVFTALSVRENLLLGGQFLSPRQREARIEALCALYPILKKRFLSVAGGLSGGERQLVSLARALMPSPRLLLLDEPSAGLSPKMLGQVFDAILHTRDTEHIAVVMVEQNAVEALRIADRAYVLSMGQVALEGLSADLLASESMRMLYLGGRAA
jgi:branched-chain amino acid transport system ATP-binding protein